MISVPAEQREVGSPPRQRSLLSWLVILSATFCITAVDRNAWQTVGPPSWGPRITCDRPAFNFGEYHVGDSLRHEFVRRHTGNEELAISKLRTTCGCVTPLVALSKVAPGRSLQLPVLVSLDVSDEDLRKQLLIESNDPMTPKFVLHVTGRVVGEAGSN